ncbi:MULTISPECIES: precorrin-2 dehydrogenase/sirohydrochlorin ferrochelatase family protein [Veillonella]|uniref:precorrin-2 dehydrogenase n=2 Tax=Veillonella TaxID=29465 RepID=C4FNJ5_9FIRM|nr:MULTISPECIES: bifunctional precorrin-2 dehydrogenase/sirohydrochlorin ferrochelatase [Veillonella]EEP66453.1 siroheme synthase domain protein [Veillonella dispar ATCC 17748]MCC2156460.1 bifunctional precorrin-2 dehydrogenase/sirohydrochlorin ferrochelatase [Veillonella fallax]VEG94077.1 Siroheme synthase [Veillonella dispar]
MVSITFQPTTEDTILFVGGGKVAERRMQLFIDEPCNIVVIAPTVTDRICQWAKDNRITWYDRAFTMDDEHHIITSSLFFICTDNSELNDTLYDMGKKHRVWTNRSDAPSACRFTVPSSLELGDLHIAISANNVGPRINRLVKQDMMNRYGQLQKAMPRLKIFREEVKLLLPTPEARQKFWRDHLTVETFEAILKGEWMTIEEKLDHEISGIRSKS